MAKSNKIVIVALVALALAMGACAIFILTARIMTSPITVDLPQRAVTAAAALREPAPPIDLRVDADNRVYWNNSPVDVNDLQRKLEEEVLKDPTNQPELRIDADPKSEYEVMGTILAQARKARIRKIDFVQ